MTRIRENNSVPTLTAVYKSFTVRSKPSHPFQAEMGYPRFSQAAKILFLSSSFSFQISVKGRGPIGAAAFHSAGGGGRLPLVLGRRHLPVTQIPVPALQALRIGLGLPLQEPLVGLGGRNHGRLARLPVCGGDHVILIRGLKRGQ